MKTKIFLLFLILLAFSVNVKAQFANEKFEIKLGEMGTFYIEFDETSYKLLNSMGDVCVAGDYKIENNIIQFNDKVGPMACAGDLGKYKFKLQDDELILELVTDECTGRPQMATAPWKKVKK
ncbi:MAG TPA: hypothetical protein PK335_12995 [Draconibacterium sp.]|nr:hypothetical protein [Draconibacterium sp.]